MLEKCNSALLISEVESFSETYETIARDIGVDMTVEKEWKPQYRMSKDVVILGSKYLPDLNKAYYPVAVVILKRGENPVPYIKEGVNHFIFDYTNQYELLMALFKTPRVLVNGASQELKDMLRESGTTRFKAGAYDFRFDMNVYLYKEQPIYLQEAQKRYLAQWLLFGNKENKHRMLLCLMRKKFGEDFLKDIDRFGQLKEEKNEQ